MARDASELGTRPGTNTAKGWKVVAPYAEAGTTWWLESLYPRRNSFEEMRLRIQQGPPHI